MTSMDAQDSVQTLNITKLAEYQPPDWLVPEVSLDFSLDPAATIVRARLRVTRGGSHERPLVLNGSRLETRWIEVNGERRNVMPEGDTLSVEIDGDEAIVET